MKDDSGGWDVASSIQSAGHSDHPASTHETEMCAASSWQHYYDNPLRYIDEDIDYSWHHEMAVGLGVASAPPFPHPLHVSGLTGPCEVTAVQPGAGPLLNGSPPVMTQLVPASGAGRDIVVTNKQRTKKSYLPNVKSGCWCCKLETCCKVQGYFMAISNGISASLLIIRLFSFIRTDCKSDYYTSCQHNRMEDDVIYLFFTISFGFVFFPVGFIGAALFLVGIYKMPE